MTSSAHPLRRALVLLVLLAVAAGGGWYWWKSQPAPLPPGIVQTNGRIEAVQIDVATKAAGRVAEVLVREGDLVEAGKVVAKMDTAALDAQLAQAEAQVAQARDAVAAAQAVVDQRNGELTLAQNNFARSEDLVARNFISPQKLDQDRAAMLTSRAALAAAKAQVVGAQSAVKAAQAAVERVRTDLADCVLKAPRTGRVQYRLAEPGEVLGAGGKVVSLLDLADVYMTVFLPEGTAGRAAVGGEARLVFDAAPQYVVPARVSFVAADAQFTPKTVETKQERQKLVFRVKLSLDPELLRKYETRVKAGVPGLAYVRVDDATAWPASLEVKLPEQ
ncbi:HlyD family secretion protein [Derxia gummosa]|uniref:HlyD family secretion protein n=1 Tax=Derxia gummosa DSM 723 TaxID=1121388 RepID=A0A8B6X806_9BURK|nr:HlyD family efflux transporter periplasmic adaptor subunit [Derxia gummosa]